MTDLLKALRCFKGTATPTALEQSFDLLSFAHARLETSSAQKLIYRSGCVQPVYAGDQNISSNAIPGV